VGGVEALALKLVVTPVLVGAASLAGRRWGSEISGWLVGIPFTSGPIAFFLALGPGKHFAAQASVGILAGALSQAAFALAYAWLAERHRWPVCLGAATAAFLAVTAVLEPLTISATATFLLAAVVLVAALAVMPRRRAAVATSAALPPWDIPARIVVATAFVVALTEAAATLGPRLAGLLAPYPLYASVLAVFAHRVEGGASAVAVLRGLTLGLFSFAGFFLAVALLVEPEGIAVAFAAALAVALLAQLASLAVGRRLQIA
jgi:hypothetical protein